MKILIAEDDLTTRVVLQSLLTKLGVRGDRHRQW